MNAHEFLHPKVDEDVKNPDANIEVDPDLKNTDEVEVDEGIGHYLWL